MSPLTYPTSPASLGLSFHPISLNISSRRNCTKVVEKYLSAKTSLEMGDNSQSFIFPRLLSLSLPLPQLLHPLILYCPRFLDASDNSAVAVRDVLVVCCRSAII